jgi:hypothetical protein
MLLSTPAEAALAEIGSFCRESADLYRDAASLAQSVPLRDMFAALASRHDEAAARIEARIRAHGDLPRMPDPEREALGELATRVKRVFAADEADVLIDERVAGEQQLAEWVDRALALDHDAATRECLADVQRLVHDALARLAAARE